MDQHDIGIINGQVIIPDSGTVLMNVYIKDGKIDLLSKDVLPAKEIINAEGKYVSPGIIDPHVHLGLFAPLDVELKSETRAALLGGVTTLGAFIGGPQSHFNSFPIIKNSIDNYSFTDLIPHLVIGTEEQCEELPKYVEDLNVTSFKIYMNGIPGMIPSVDDSFIFSVAEKIKKTGKNCMLCSHTENSHMVAWAVKKLQETKGSSATIVDWSETHPVEVEVEAVYRLAYLAELAQVPVYIVHLTSAKAVEALRRIRIYNKFVNVETTSPYLAITRNHPQGNALKMEPPFRDQVDVDGLWKGIEDGIIDTIGTDNVTETIAEKNLKSSNIWEIMPGYAACEHHLSVALDEGVIKRGIPIERVIACMTKNPAQKFGIYPQKGAITPGSDADVVVIDMNISKEVKASETATRSDFSIYEGRKFQGWPVVTIKGGEIFAKDGKIIKEEPNGVCIVR